MKPLHPSDEDTARWRLAQKPEVVFELVLGRNASGLATAVTATVAEPGIMLRNPLTSVSQKIVEVGHLFDDHELRTSGVAAFFWGYPYGRSQGVRNRVSR